MVDFVRGIDKLPEDTRLAVTVGVFDGVHRGHQTLFQRAIVTFALNGVVTSFTALSYSFMMVRRA